MEREIVCTLQIENKEESKNIREERQREKTREKKYSCINVHYNTIKLTPGNLSSEYEHRFIKVVHTYLDRFT